jgi:hypothetical protein
MSLDEIFKQSEYQDAPWLSDQLLLPNLAVGNSLYMVSAFCPSYVFKLARDLASSEEIEPGIWSLVFYVPGDLNVKSEAIARFKSYLSKYASSEAEVAQFVTDCLQLIAEGGLHLSVAHASSKRALTKGSMGVITSPEDNDRFVSFVDAKGGDFNSPVKPLQSWNDEDFFSSREIFDNVEKITRGARPGQRLVGKDEVFDWLSYIDEWFANNATNVDEDEDAEEDDDDIDTDLLDFLQDLEEFENENEYEWVSTLEEDTFHVSDFAGFTVVTDPSEAVRGHIPPLNSAIRDLYGPAAAVCICGAKFIRAYGCDEVTWDGYGESDEEY